MMEDNIMKKKYIRPALFQQDVAATAMICDSIQSGGEDNGYGTPEARGRVACDDEDHETLDW